MKLLKNNKPTTLICTNNLEYEMDWDSSEPLFLIQYDEKIVQHIKNNGYSMHPLVPEIIVWSKALDFQTTYIARKQDFDELEMF